jgi:hypothetical protein
MSSKNRMIYPLPIFPVRELDDAKVGGFCKDAGYNGMVGAASVGVRYLEPSLASAAYVHGKEFGDRILGAAIIGSAAAMGIAYINKAASPK